MAKRAKEGVTPVTETEFADLAAWLTTHRDRLLGLLGASEKVRPRGGKSVEVDRPVRKVARGPRVLGAGRVAEQVRRLRLHYPGEAP